MENADLEVQAKCPIMMCPGHHFTTLVVLNCHLEVMHGGIKDTLTELRSQFRVVNLLGERSTTIHLCWYGLCSTIVSERVRNKGMDLLLRT